MELNSSSSRAFFLVQTDLSQINTLSFNLMYVPALGAEAAALYNLLYEFYHRNNILRTNTYSKIDELLTFLDVDFEQFNLLRSKLEIFNLLKTTYGKEKNNNQLYCFEIIKPLDLHTIFQNQKLILILKQHLGSRAELVFLNAKTLISSAKNDISLQHVDQVFNISNDSDDEIIKTLRQNNAKINDNQENQLVDPALEQLPISSLISDEIKNQFYSEIFLTIKKPFIVEEKIWSLVYLYGVEQKIFTIDELALMAYRSLVQKKDQIRIVYEQFQLLILDELKVDDDHEIKIDQKSLKKFWISSVNLSDQEFIKAAKKIFINFVPEKFYQIINKKVPTKGIKGWIKTTQANNWTIGSINVLFSFVKTWINNINLSYLKKVEETLTLNEKISFKEVLLHCKNVIVSDYHNGNNKLNIIKTDHELDNNQSLDKDNTNFNHDDSNQSNNENDPSVWDEIFEQN
ncbi:hypothetical protein MCAV_01020 [[Mycoplasma] cavipharyngis]|uniref:hypothetical protein n=1 Tax=[Mycoplasma] cavipharyngis TaxID=92757 RepID=UPI003704D3A8